MITCSIWKQPNRKWRGIVLSLGHYFCVLWSFQASISSEAPSASVALARELVRGVRSREVKKKTCFHRVLSPSVYFSSSSSPMKPSPRRLLVFRNVVESTSLLVSRPPLSVKGENLKAWALLGLSVSKEGNSGGNAVFHFLKSTTNHATDSSNCLWPSFPWNSLLNCHVLWCSECCELETSTGYCPTRNAGLSEK